jgi:hypothetical protein
MKLSLRQKDVSNHVCETTNLLNDLGHIVSQYVYHGSFKMKPVPQAPEGIAIHLASHLHHNGQRIEWQKTGNIGGYLINIDLCQLTITPEAPYQLTITPEAASGTQSDFICLFSGETEEEIWLFQTGLVIVFSATNLLKLRTVDWPFLTPLWQQFYSIEGENVLLVVFQGEVTIFE